MARFNFNLRNPSADKPTPIYLIVRYTNKRIVYPTGESIHPSCWQSDTSKRNHQRAIQSRRFPQHPEFNQRLENLQNQAQDCFRRFINDQGREPSPKELRDALDRQLGRLTNDFPEDFFGFFDYFIESSRSRTNPKTGSRIAIGTIKKYRTTYNKIQQYAREQRRTLTWAAIDLRFHQDFIDFLHKRYDMSANAVGKHIKTLKTMLNFAEEHGIKVNPAFRSPHFIAPQEEAENIYLDEDELAALAELDLTNERLARVRDLFLIGCWTGLRFSDFTAIEPHNITGNRIAIKTKKTGKKVVIPIHASIKPILERYGGSLPAEISNQKMNAYVKELASMVPELHVEVHKSITRGGIRRSVKHKKYEMVTTHTARRSFATNLYKAGVPSLTIMQITGHRTEKAFLKYIKVTSEEHADLLETHWQSHHKLTVV